jgi:hypothetical protein
MSTNLPTDPSYFLDAVVLWLPPFVVFFLGIVIRKEVCPGPNSPPLLKQLLMGIPVSLVIVSSLIAGVQLGIDGHIPSYIFTLGVLMEHGMLVSETLVQHLEKLTRMATGETRVAQGKIADSIPSATS